MHPPATKIAGRSGCLHPHHKIADSLRLWAFFVLSIHQKRGASQALCTLMLKIADRLRLCAPPIQENRRVSQALCSPMMKVADSLRRCAPPPERKLGDASGYVHLTL